MVTMLGEMLSTETVGPDFQHETALALIAEPSEIMKRCSNCIFGTGDRAQKE